MQAKNSKREGKILSKGNYFMGNLSKLPERLKKLMVDRGINAPHLAEKLGVGSNTITRYLQGVGSPSFEIFIKLVEYFNCSAGFLLGREEQPFYEKKFLPLAEFAKRFREVMTECNITQYALHRKTGISWNNFHKWLKGERLPNANSLLKLAVTMDCSVDFLLGRIKTRDTGINIIKTP